MLGPHAPVTPTSRPKVLPHQQAAHQAPPAKFASAVLLRSAVILALVMASCTNTMPADDTSSTLAPDTVPAVSVPTTTSTVVAAAPVEPIADRISIRVVDGVGEFFNVATGETFIPRGVNYVDFQPTSFGGYEDRVFATNTYDRDKVREAFRTLASRGYNTARIFFDNCGIDPECVARASGTGLNPPYLDNMVEVMRIAGEEGIWLVLTANSLPDTGGYWAVFDSHYRQGHQGFDGRENADWLHTGGVEAKAKFWDDLMSGLSDRDAPFEVLLGWQLTNEFWLHKLFEPMSSTTGLVEAANGLTYDMADPDQKRAMVIDGVVYFIDRIRGIIDEYDPDTLVTMGFFTPQFPNPTYIGEDWFVDTAPLLDRADLDFFDFHAYYDTDLTPAQQAENYGMPGFEAKPVLMGETGSGKATVPSALAALGRGYQFIAESCEAGWDGWLNWGYYVWPDDQPGPAWAFLDSDGTLLDGFSPQTQPDACVVPDDAPVDLTRGTKPRVSGSEQSRPPANAIDDSLKGWGAGGFPPQWIEIEFAGPSTVVEIGLGVDQWPPGITHHRVWATLADGRRVLVADMRRFTAPEMLLDFEIAPALDDVVSVRVETLESTSWVAWREIEVISAPAPSGACIVQGGPLRVEPSAGADSVQGTSSVYVLAEARYGGDGEWLRVAGDRWITADQGTCPDLPVAQGPTLDLAEVRFEVEVPPGTGEVFMPGVYGAGIPEWYPYIAYLLPNESTVRSVTMLLPVGETVQYTFTHDGWTGVERDASCRELERSVTVSAGLVVRDTVAKWSDAC